MPDIEKLITVNEVHTEFERLIRDRNHMGLRNLLGDTFLEPRNPFQKSSRRLKKWAGALVGVALLALLIVWYFHLRK